MPTAAHFIYIPAVLLIGVVIGYILGGRATRDAMVAAARRKEARQARRRAEAEEEAAPTHPSPEEGAT